MQALTRNILTSRPFTLAEARSFGFRWEHLQTDAWTKLSRGQYVAKDLARYRQVILHAVERRLPSRHAFSGRTAAILLGVDMPPLDPIEVTVDRNVSVRARAGIKLRRAGLSDSDVVTRGCFQITSPLRTIRDLGSRPDFVEALASVDMVLHADLLRLSELEAWVAEHRGEKGVKRLRRIIQFADSRSESPMESRLRAYLIKARLPVPDVQAELHDASGRFVGRADLYYPDRRLVIEFDGMNHRDRLVSDLRRQNALIEAGYHVLRFSAADLRTPGLVVTQVRDSRRRLAKMP